MARAQEFLSRFHHGGQQFLERIVTGDETWVYSWDPELKRQSALWLDEDEPRPVKVCCKLSALKIMHIMFFYVQGIILSWPVPTGTNVNANYYKMVLQEKLRPAIRKKRPGLLETGVIFHHDNAPVHSAKVVTSLLESYEWEIVPRPRYSPDLAPCDFHLFPKIKEHLRGRRFDTAEDIILDTKEAILKLDKVSYVAAFESWIRRWKKSLDNAGDYFE